MPKQPDLYYACKLKPQDAIKYFEEKGYRISWNWQDTWQEAHAKAFTIAKMTQLDLLQDTKAIVQKAINEGWTEKQFIKQAAPMLKSKGWWGKETIKDEAGEEKVIQKGSPYRLKTIYRTNVQTSYMAGRYKQQIDSVDIQPFWEYVAILDNRTRPEHRELNGKVFKYDDPFWDNFYPPNGWGCRCRVKAVDEDYLKDKKINPESSDGKMSEEFRIISKETGEARLVSTYDTTDLAGKKIKVETDPGWSYNPGKAWYQPDLDSYPYEVAKQYIEGVVTGPPFEYLYTQTAKNVESLLKENSKIEALKILRNQAEKTNVFPVAVIDEDYQKLLGSKTQVVKLSEDTLAKQFIEHPEIELKDYKKLPNIISNAEVITQEEGQKFVFLKDSKDKFYLAVVKNTKDKKELYLVSLFNTDEREVLKRLKRGQVLKNELFPK